ncbi:unnamed protein product [Orchesella dallaii]|uniref:Uncharacterized protein n=1 Tax=Orchesella dallaii TaxID=48710 RepID=A0ABP1RJ13_9HEXA
MHFKGHPNIKISPKIPSDGPSILEAYSIVTPTSELTTLDHTEPSGDIKDKPLCKSSKLKQLKEDVLDGIDRILKFYESHSNISNGRIDTIVGLTALREFCRKIVEVIKTSTKSWKSANIVNQRAMNVSKVGHEPEYMWGSIKEGCLSALIVNCEMPHVCEKTLGAETPESQYFLAHQLMYRILMNQMSDCFPKKNFINEEVNHQLCAKMYREAELVDKLNYPEIHRHLFGEYVGFCGFMGYPNFLREDWLESLLSWQSRSEYGCFTYNLSPESSYEFKESYFLERLSTPSEIEKGILPKETCAFPTTTVGLLTLAIHWDYMEENCQS